MSTTHHPRHTPSSPPFLLFSKTCSYNPHTQTDNLLQSNLTLLQTLYPHEKQTHTIYNQDEVRRYHHRPLRFRCLCRRPGHPDRSTREYSAAPLSSSRGVCFKKTPGEVTLKWVRVIGVDGNDGDVDCGKTTQPSRLIPSRRRRPRPRDNSPATRLGLYLVLSLISLLRIGCSYHADCTRSRNLTCPFRPPLITFLSHQLPIPLFAGSAQLRYLPAGTNLVDWW
jgi:hypothetical protein